MTRTLLTGAALAAALVAASPPVSVALPPAPPVASFLPGSCREAAPALVALRETAWQVSAARRPDLAVAREAGRTAQRAVIAIRDGAEPGLAAALQDVVVAAGFFRIRVDSKTFENELAHDLLAAYLTVERRCVTRAQDT